MADMGELHAILRDFAETLVAEYDIDAILDELCDRAVELLPIDGAGVTLADEDGDLRFVAASNETIAHIEELQDRLREGPCMSAHARREIVMVADIKQTDEWPNFGHAAQAAGMRTIGGFPMAVDTTPIGVLNVYAEDPDVFESEDVDAARILADVATTYVLTVEHGLDVEKERDQLQYALTSRIVIEQAKGLLAGRHDIPIEVALKRLRGHARDNNRTLHDVAREVLDGSLAM